MVKKTFDTSSHCIQIKLYANCFHTKHRSIHQYPNPISVKPTYSILLTPKLGISINSHNSFHPALAYLCLEAAVSRAAPPYSTLLWYSPDPFSTFLQGLLYTSYFILILSFAYSHRKDRLISSFHPSESIVSAL